MGSDGKRLILSAISTDVVFTAGGKFYYQTAQGFIGDITTTPFRDAAVRLQPFTRIMEVELQVILGIIAGSSGIGFAIVIGTEATLWLVKHRPNIMIINDRIAKFFQAREIVKTCAPTMYEFLFNQAMRSYTEKLTQAITPEVLGFFAGVLIGHFGKDCLEGHPLTPFRIIWVVSMAIGARTLMDVLPDAAKLAKEEIEDPDRVLQRARSGRVTITRQQFEQMAHEVAAHKNEMKRAYHLLDEAFNG